MGPHNDKKSAIKSDQFINSLFSGLRLNDEDEDSFHGNY